MSKDSILTIEEERRLLYVAITRAEKNCVITYAKSRFRNGSNVNCQPSRFIKDMDDKFLVNSATSKTPVQNYTESDYRPFNNKTSSSSYNSFNENKSSLKPLTNAISKPTPPNSVIHSNDSGFSLHNLDEINEGNEIIHNRFGKGVITKIDNSGNAPKIIVEFEVMGQRTLLLKYAKFKIC